MSKFTAAELVEFYQKVADGGKPQCGSSDCPWYDHSGGPTPASHVEHWRIKPAKNIIDMSHLVKSGIDCEFNEKYFGDGNWVKANLTNIGPGEAYWDEHGASWSMCRPRINYNMYHDGGECPLPEGFRIKVYHRFSVEMDIITRQTGHESWTWKHRSHSQNIIGYEILGLAEGWAYPWECEE